MGSRSVVRRALPGLFRSSIDTRIGGSTRATKAMSVVRAAQVSLYSAGIGGPVSEIPRLDVVSSTSTAANEFRNNPAIYAPLWRIAFRMGALPLKVYEFTGGDNRKQRREASDHPAYKILRAPNPDLASNLLISGSVFSMFIHSRVGWLKERRDPFGPRNPQNPVIAVWPIPGNALFPVRTDKRLLAAFKLRVLGYPEVTLDPRDVCYFRLMPDPDDWAGSTGPLEPLGAASIFGNEALRAMIRLFRSALLQRLWVDLHGEDLDDVGRDRLRTELEIAAQQGGIPVLEGGATLETMGEGPNHELLARATDLVRSIVRNTLGLPEDESDLQFFYSEVVQPIADVIERELERSFMPDFEAEAFPEFQFREILAGNPLERAQLHQTRILSGQETPNEARSAENERPLDGGDQLFVPLNLVPIDAAGAVQAAKAKDTAGGLGGREGRGTTPKIASTLTGGKQRPAAKVATADEEFRARAAGEGNWRHARARAIKAQSDQLERRLRGAVNQELDDLRALLAERGQSPNGARPESFTSDANSAIDRTDIQMRSLLAGYMDEVAVTGVQLAAQLIQDPTAEPAQITPSAAIRQTVEDRAASMSDHFSERRREEVAGMSDMTTARSLDDALRDRWKVMADHFARIIGETETAWAFERSASDGWAQLGVQDIAVVKEDGECRTGMCVDVVSAGRFRTSEVPTPLHPGCNCFVMPAQFVE